MIRSTVLRSRPIQLACVTLSLSLFFSISFSFLFPYAKKGIFNFTRGSACHSNDQRVGRRLCLSSNLLGGLETLPTSVNKKYQHRAPNNQQLQLATSVSTYACIFIRSRKTHPHIGKQKKQNKTTFWAGLSHICS